MNQTFEEYLAETIVLKTDLDKSIHANSATSPLNDIQEPTLKELENDDYIKGKIIIQGLTINIENPYGTQRKGVDIDGKEWSVELIDNYGEIHGYDAADEDYIDIFIRKHLTQKEVDTLNVIYVIDQIDPKTNKFDEHKVILGYNSTDEAKQSYLLNYEPNWKGLGSITPLTMSMFKYWLKNENIKNPLVWNK